MLLIFYQKISGMNSHEFRDHDYYLITTSRGSFVILDEKQFPRHYLNLGIKNAIKIHIEES